MTTRLIRICRAEEVEEGSPLPVNVSGLQPLAVYQVGDAYYATDNLCTHGRAFLTDGVQEGLTIECPLHGGAFDIASGAPTSLPCRVALNTYVVKQDGDELFVAQPEAVTQ
ncbi:MAG: ferredoxin subunit of nitrite reductase and ring-hydroxylating dioxygenase [Herminiimonas sp.]|jgi:nitrite reductase/ring-hydroxylating ferredoxin subunit|nr:ferredoxin subunit of nitrite reductase and ring-hydroxylating dioxygenase [Herminiimonas sp.]